MENNWFKAKKYGWGWAPATWQAWIIMLIYVLLMAVILVNSKKFFNSSDIILKVVVPCLVLSIVLIFICYLTGEKPRWRWGED